MVLVWTMYPMIFTQGGDTLRAHCGIPGDEYGSFSCADYPQNLHSKNINIHASIPSNCDISLVSWLNQELSIVWRHLYGFLGYCINEVSQVRFPVSRFRLYLPTNVEIVWKTADFYDMAAMKAFSHTNVHTIDLCFDLLRSVYDVAIHVIPHNFVDWNI